jgi:hypothetical protein
VSEEEKEIIRLQGLIGKYIKHVIDCEGTDFFGLGYNRSISMAEQEELRGYYEEYIK